MSLNRAAAVGFAEGPGARLADLDKLADEPQLAAYNYLASARAQFLQQLRRTDEARLAFTEAIALTENDVERAFLTTKLALLEHGSWRRRNRRAR